jgi:PAS domain S-box-containing protein
MVGKKVLNRLETSLAGAALFILLLTILFSYQGWTKFGQANEETVHARQVIDETEALLSSMTDAESGERGFLLTGDRRYLEPYEKSLLIIPRQLQRLATLTAAHRQGDRVKRLEALVGPKLALLKRAIDARTSQATAAIDIEQAELGKRAMDQIRQVCSEITSEEYAGMIELSHAAELHNDRTGLFAVFGSATLFVFLLISGGIIASTAARREQLIGELRSSEKQTAEVRDLMQTTLASIGDAVIATDALGKVTFINPVAQSLTQFTQEQAAGKALDEVFRIVNETTRETVASPVAKVLREGAVVGLANHTVLLSRNGAETPIDDSGAPIRDPNGSIAGVVLVFRDITARKKAEEESLRLAAIVESSGDAIIAQRMDGVVTSWNTASERMFGYSAAEIVGRNFSILIPEGSAEGPFDDLESLRRGEPAIHHDSVRRRKDGSLVDVATTMSPIRDAAGNVVGASRICRDISDRRRADEALQRSNRQIAGILESIRDGFVAIDKDWVFTYVNKEAERILGTSRSELIGKSCWQEFPDALGTSTEARMRRAATERVRISFEEFYSGLNGWFEISLYPAADGGLSIYFRNVTERKRTLEALLESEERLRLSAEAGQIGAWNNDLVARRVTWSPQLEKLFGLAPGSFRGTNEHARELVHPEDREYVMEVINRAVERRTDFDVEFRFIRPDGETGWMFVRGRPRFDEAGIAVSMAGVAIDVSSRKRLEEKMRQAQKLESLGVLAGGIAHDFNNLLVGILGNAGILMDDTPADSPLRSVIENLLQAGERAAHLTRQMLAYSGKGRFVIERLDLRQQAQQIVSLIGASIPKGVTLALDFQPDLPPIEGDSGQLQQLIMNLVINGAEAIESGVGTVTVSTGLREIDASYVKDNLAGDNIPPGAYVVLEVHDSGVGMDTTTQAKIFDPFFTTKFAGRGLGLAAVLGIVRGHKGALTVYSEPGKGTTFKVFLPVAGAGTPASIEPGAALEFRGEATILVVDDEEVIQRTLKAALERYGYTVVSASGGEEAARIVKEMRDPIELVLLDMTMPVLSGEETFKRLQAIRRDLPVIATSGYNEVEALRRFGDGLSGFIQKPFTPRQLAERIRAVLERKRPMAAGDGDRT